MIEAETSFCSFTELIETIERMVKYIIKQTLQSSREELQFFEELGSGGIFSRLQSLLKEQFRVVSYDQCIELLRERGQEGTGSSALETITWGTDLSSEDEKYITTHFRGPVFVKDYPSKLKAFYMKENRDGKTVACVDLLFPFVGEIVGGSSREEDHKKLVQRATLQGLNTKKLTWYLNLRKNGYSPSAGFGLGLERLLMFITGSTNIRDTIPFPRAAGELQF